MSSWQCPDCSTVNSVNAMRCVACDGERPIAPPAAAPTPPRGVERPVTPVVDPTMAVRTPRAPSPAPRAPKPAGGPEPAAPGPHVARTASLAVIVVALCLLVGGVAFLVTRSTGGDARADGPGATGSSAPPTTTADVADVTDGAEVEPGPTMPASGSMAVAQGTDTMPDGRPLVVVGRPVQVTYDPADPDLVTGADLLVNGSVVASGTGGTIEWTSPALARWSIPGEAHRTQARLHLADGSELTVDGPAVAISAAPAGVVAVVDDFTGALASGDWATAASISTDPLTVSQYIEGYDAYPHAADRIVLTPASVQDLGGGAWDVRGVLIAEEGTHTRVYCVLWTVDTSARTVQQHAVTDQLTGPGPDEAWSDHLVSVEEAVADAAAGCGH